MPSRMYADFRQKQNGCTTKRRGIQVGNLILCQMSAPSGFASNSPIMIFSPLNGKPVLPFGFASLPEAETVAGWLCKIYHDEQNGDLFDILQAWPEQDIVSLCQWHVTGGIIIYEAVQSLKDQDIITLEQLQKALDQAKAKYN